MTAQARPHVLVVDDDLGTRELFRIALRLAGFDVTTAADGIGALRQIERKVPDAIVLDLDLPYVSGIAVQEELLTREESRRVPVIIVTGTDWHSPFASAATLTKPVSSDEVVAAIQAALSSRR